MTRNRWILNAWLGLGLAGCLAFAGDPPKSAPKAEIKELEPSLFSGDVWRLDVKYEIEFDTEHARNPVDPGLVLTLIERGKAVMDKDGKPLEFFVLLGNPAKSDSKEWLFEGVTSVDMPKDTGFDPLQVELTAVLIDREAEAPIRESRNRVKFVPDADFAVDLAERATGGAIGQMAPVVGSTVVEPTPVYPPAVSDSVPLESSPPGEFAIDDDVVIEDAVVEEPYPLPMTPVVESSVIVEEPLYVEQPVIVESYPAPVYVDPWPVYYPAPYYSPGYSYGGISFGFFYRDYDYYDHHHYGHYGHHYAHYDRAYCRPNRWGVRHVDRISHHDYRAPVRREVSRSNSFSRSTGPRSVTSSRTGRTDVFSDRDRGASRDITRGDRGGRSNSALSTDGQRRFSAMGNNSRDGNDGAPAVSRSRSGSSGSANVAPRSFGSERSNQPTRTVRTPRSSGGRSDAVRSPGSGGQSKAAPRTFSKGGSSPTPRAINGSRSSGTPRAVSPTRSSRPSGSFNAPRSGSSRTSAFRSSGGGSSAPRAISGSRSGGSSRGMSSSRGGSSSRGMSSSRSGGGSRGVSRGSSSRGGSRGGSRGR